MTYRIYAFLTVFLFSTQVFAVKIHVHHNACMDSLFLLETISKKSKEVELSEFAQDWKAKVENADVATKVSIKAAARSGLLYSSWKEFCRKGFDEVKKMVKANDPRLVEASEKEMIERYSFKKSEIKKAKEAKKKKVYTDKQRKIDRDRLEPILVYFDFLEKQKFEKDWKLRVKGIFDNQIKVTQSWPTSETGKKAIYGIRKLSCKQRKNCLEDQDIYLNGMVMKKGKKSSAKKEDHGENNYLTLKFTKLLAQVYQSDVKPLKKPQDVSKYMEMYRKNRKLMTYFQNYNDIESFDPLANNALRSYVEYIIRARTKTELVTAFQTSNPYNKLFVKPDLLGAQLFFALEKQHRASGFPDRAFMEKFLRDFVKNGSLIDEEGIKKSMAPFLGIIGISFTQENGKPTVVENNRGDTGFKKGDVIEAIDNRSVLNKDMDGVSAMMRGKPGTKRVVEVVRNKKKVKVPVELIHMSDLRKHSKKALERQAKYQKEIDERQKKMGSLLGSRVTNEIKAKTCQRPLTAKSPAHVRVTRNLASMMAPTLQENEDCWGTECPQSSFLNTNALDSNVHLIGAYEGPEGAFDKKGKFQPGGEVKVTIHPTTKPIRLLLASYHNIAWSLNLLPGAKVEKVYYLSYDKGSRVEFTGKKAPIENVDDKDVSFYSHSWEEKSTGTEGYISDDYLRRVKPIRKFAGQMEKTFQGNYKRETFHVPFYKDEKKELARQKTKLKEVTAQKIEKLSEPEMKEALSRSQACTSKHGRHQGLCRAGYQLGSKGVTDIESNKLIALPSELPRISWASGLAYDSKRQRLVLTTSGGEGYAYEFNLKDKKWNILSSMNNVDYGGLAYDAEKDVFWSITSNKVVKFDSNMKVIGNHEIEMKFGRGTKGASNLAAHKGYLLSLPGPKPYSGRSLDFQIDLDCFEMVIL